MKKFNLCALCWLTIGLPVYSQLPCPEITSSTMSPASGTFCPGDEITLTWEGIHMEYASGFCWYFYAEDGSNGITLACPMELTQGPCASSEILYVMANPDDNLVGSSDDCHDEFIVMYIGGPNPVDWYGNGGVPSSLTDLGLCFEFYLGPPAHCATDYPYDFVPGNASTFNCGTPIGPNNLIPENSILVIQTSIHNNIQVDLGEICNLGLPVYIIAMDTPPDCTGGFIPNSTGECSGCTLGVFPDWCDWMFYEGGGKGGGDGSLGYAHTLMEYDLPSAPENGWGISNAIGGGVFGSAVPEIELPELYTGTEVTSLPFTWEIPSDFCQDPAWGSGIYHIIGGAEYTGVEGCPPPQTELYTLTIECPDVSAGPDQLICHGDLIIIDGSESSGSGTYEWSTNGDGEFEDPFSLQTTYIPGSNDLLSGSVILTLTLLTNSESCGSAIDELILTFAEPIEINTTTDLTICATNVAELNVSAFGGAGDLLIIWTSDGDGLFEDMNSEQTLYTPGPDDINTGSVTVTITAFDALGICDPVSSEISITILPSIMPVIMGIPTSLCHTENAIVLPTVHSGVLGTWSGQGVSNNQFNPSGLSGNIELTFTPDPEQCAETVTTIIHVNPVTIPIISGITSSLCQSDASIVLPTIQDNIAGNWSGAGVVNNTFNPAGLSGFILLAFTPDAGQCAAVAQHGITVNIPFIPIVTGIPSGTCEDAPPLLLPTSQDGIIGNWSGQGVISNTFNPSGLIGVIELTFTPDADQCALVAITTITIENVLIPEITGIPNSLCETAGSIILQTLQDGVTGSWSGPGVFNNTFNPSGLTGTVTLTYTPAPEQCASETTTDILILSEIVVFITGIPQAMCQSANEFPLPTIQGGITGHWSGEGVANNLFNPSGLVGIVTLFFIPNTDQCADTAQTTIAVEPIIIPVLAGIPTSLCEMDEVVYLMTQFDNISGNWSGEGISNNAFNPDSLSGFVSITFTPNPDQCAEAASTTIEVFEPFEPELSGIPLSLCQQADAILLPDIPDGISGTWSGPGILNNILNPSDQNGVLIISFTPDDGQCANPTSTQIEVNTPPAFINLEALCDSTSQSYLVSFDIIGGDPSSYLVNGSPLTGTQFVSAPINALLTEYTFLLDDANGCGPVIISGMLDCACATSAGTMNISGNTLNVCEGSDFTVQYFNNALLDPDDLLQFVLHDQAGTQLGNVLAISTTPTFSTPPGIVSGQTYYVSAIAGSNNGNGEIDLTDACLSVSQGVPVIFYKPGIQLSDGMDVCYPDCISYTIQFQGEAPFEFDYEILANDSSYSFTHLANTNSGTIVLCPSDFNLGSGTLTLLPLMITDANCLFPPEELTGLTSIVHNSTTSSFYQELCAGESISLHGQVFDQSNPLGSVVIPDGNQFGCDSIIEVTLSYREPSNHAITQTLCYGASLFINGTEYNEENPSGTEILPGGNQFGCDSIIQIDLMFSSLITGEYTSTLCSDASVTINGTTYNQSNPSGAEFFPGGSSSGCDSLVNINLSFYPEATSDFSASLCNGEFLVINGIIYDEANPEGFEVLKASSMHGCDSVIHVNLTFYPDVYSYIIDTLRAGEHLIVNGNIYDQSHPSGVEVIPGGSSSGCDSIIEVSLHFGQALSLLFQAIAPACYGESTGTINLAGIAGGTSPYLISIDGGDPVIVSAFPTILTGLIAGGHSLHIRDANLNSLDVEVDIPEAPILEVDAGMDQSIQRGENAQLIAEANFDVSYWNWSPPDFLSCTDCPDPLAVKPDESIYYTVTATDQNGCIATDLVAVEVISKVSYYTPSIFSPNGDQINDTWFISSNEPDAIVTSMSIYDRWGGILFSSSFMPVNSSEAGWDGTSQGQSLDPGVYVFVVSVVNEAGKTEYLHGDITLIR